MKPYLIIEKPNCPGITNDGSPTAWLCTTDISPSLFSLFLCFFPYLRFTLKKICLDFAILISHMLYPSWSGTKRCSIFALHLCLSLRFRSTWLFLHAQVAPSPLFSSLQRWHLPHSLPPCTGDIFPILFLSSQGTTSKFPFSLKRGVSHFHPPLQPPNLKTTTLNHS
jgi:hypothetical protein